MTLLTKDQILGMDDREHKDVQVPEWGGGTVRLKAMAASERDSYEAEAWQAKQKNGEMGAFENVRARLVARCAVNEDGTPMFENAEEVAQLGSKNAAVVDRLFDVCRKLNGMSKEDVAELEGN